MLLLLPAPDAETCAESPQAASRDWRTATAYGILTMIGKWAHVAGQRQYQRDRAAGKNTRLIDYKAAGARQPETAAA